MIQELGRGSVGKELSVQDPNHLYNSWACVEVPLAQSLSNGERELLGQAILRNWLISKLWVQMKDSASDE